LIDLGVNLNLIEKAGTWFAFGKERLGQGRDNARKYLKENPEVAASIDAKVREAMGMRPAPQAKPPAEPAPALDEAVRKKMKPGERKD
jgi:recombination protein RecA